MRQISRFYTSNGDFRLVHIDIAFVARYKRKERKQKLKQETLSLPFAFLAFFVLKALLFWQDCFIRLSFIHFSRFNMSFVWTISFFVPFFISWGVSPIFTIVRSIVVVVPITIWIETGSILISVRFVRIRRWRVV